MDERLMLANTDPEISSGFVEQIRKWGGRLAFTAAAAYYLDTYWQHFSRNRTPKKSEGEINHEYQETPEDHNQ